MLSPALFLPALEYADGGGTGGTTAQEDPEETRYWEAETVVRMRTSSFTPREVTQLQSLNGSTNERMKLAKIIDIIAIDRRQWITWYKDLMQGQFQHRRFKPLEIVGARDPLFPIMKGLRHYDRERNFYDAKSACCWCLSKFHFMPAGCACKAHEWSDGKFLVPDLLACSSAACHQCMRCGLFLG